MFSFTLFVSTYLTGWYAALRISPVFAFVLYQAVYFYHPENRWWGNMLPTISYSFYVVALMALLTILVKDKTGGNSVLKNAPLLWMWVLIALYGITNFYSVFPEGHLEASINFLKTGITMTLAYKLINTPKKLDYVLWGFIYGAAYLGYYISQIGRNSGSRVEGIGTVDSPEANSVAAALAPALVLCLYYFWKSPNWKVKFILAVAGSLVANAVVLINSRGTFLAIVASIGFFMYQLFTQKVRKDKQRRIAFGILIIGVVGFFKVADESFIERMANITKVEKSEERETAATRTYFWAATLDMVKDKPLGEGYRTFNFYAPFYLEDHIVTGGSRNRTVHSTWFEALSEIGYLGLLLLLLMLWSCRKALKKTLTHLKTNNLIDEYYKVLAIYSSLICFMVSMTFINRLRAEILYWCVLFAACAYNVYVLKKEKTDTNSLSKNM